MDLSALQEWMKKELCAEGEPLPELAELPRPLLTLLARWQEQTEALERHLEQTEQLLAFFRASANAMPNPIFLKNEELRYVFFNDAYKQFFGLAPGEHIGERVQDLAYLSEEDRHRYPEEDSEMLHSLSSIQYETPFTTADGSLVDALYWSRGFPVPETGRRGLVGEIVDISKEKELQRNLERSMRTLNVLLKDARDASRLDPLTKLYNRSVLEEEVPFIVRESTAMDRPVCAILIDLDHFKQINDGYSHQVGDEILQGFAHLLRKAFRQQDTAIRYGGDEFMLLLPGAAVKHAVAGLTRLREMVRRKLPLPDGKPVTLSIGVTRCCAGETVESFLARADEALYYAKEHGRDCIGVKEEQGSDPYIATARPHSHGC